MKTSAGIAKGGIALAEYVRSVRRDMSNVTTVSFVGFSMGGLYIRYAAGLLTQDAAECKPGSPPTDCGLQFGMLMTIASPNLGIRGALWHIYDAAIGAGALGQTGRELSINIPADWDGDAAWAAMQETPPHAPVFAQVSAGGHVHGASASAIMNVSELPLLLQLVHPQQRWWQALQAFKVRVAAASLRGDDKVPYWSAALAPCANTYGDGMPSNYPAHSTQDATLKHLHKSSCNHNAMAVHSVDTSLPKGHIQRAVQTKRPQQPVYDAAATVLDTWPNPKSPEAIVAAYMHAAGSWIVVDVDFGEHSSSWFNHFRMGGVGFPILNLGYAGDEVPRYLASLPMWAMVSRDMES